MPIIKDTDLALEVLVSQVTCVAAGVGDTIVGDPVLDKMLESINIMLKEVLFRLSLD